VLINKIGAAPTVGEREPGQAQFERKIMGIYKICTQQEWAAAQKDGVYLGSAVDAEDGFIHFSNGVQTPETARRYFSGQTDLVLVAVDDGQLGNQLKWEPSRDGDLFPHLYGTLALDAVIWVKGLPVASDGEFRFPDEVALDRP
jgi:uncharacterized protein (DUF952 family)